MSSQKIGPSSLASRARCCTGAVESSDSMLPTTGCFGGCGIGFSLFGDAIVELPPAILLYSKRHLEVRALARLEGWVACTCRRILRGSPKWLAPQDDDTCVVSPKP